MESNKIKHSQSKINKIGLFSNALIRNGEIVYIKGGHILLRSDFFSSSVINSYLPISDDYVIGAISPKEEKEIKLYNNHSCEPNCGMRGDITFIAIKDIGKDEELTIDYAFVDNESYRFKCNCGSNHCRKVVTGFDWQIDTIQKHYSRKYFSAYIQSKIMSGFRIAFYSGLSEHIRELRKDVFVGELGFSVDDEFDGDETNYRHCCLYIKDKLAAYARVKIEGNAAHISRLIVRKEVRGKGYGKQMMFWAETEALKADIYQVYVHSLVDKIDFYKMLDYTTDGNLFIEDGREHAKMSKILTLD